MRGVLCAGAPVSRARAASCSGRGSARVVVATRGARTRSAASASSSSSFGRTPRRDVKGRATNTGGKATPRRSPPPPPPVVVSPPSPPAEAMSMKGTYRGEDDGVASGADCMRALRTMPPTTFSNADAYFTEKLGAEFVFGQRPDADLDELNALFATVGFPQRDPVRLKRALVNSHLIVWVVATDKNKSRATHVGQVIGFARVTSDKVFNGTIWDVVVSPEWQGAGIGRGMVERLVDKMLEEGINNVSLYAEPAVVKLYNDCGFEIDPGGTTGMAFRVKSRRRK